MIPDDASAIATRLMSNFAMRTGLSSAALRPQRYLWTDAFAICNFFELFTRSGDQTHRRYAIDLIDQVHQYSDDIEPMICVAIGSADLTTRQGAIVRRRPV